VRVKTYHPKIKEQEMRHPAWLLAIVLLMSTTPVLRADSSVYPLGTTIYMPEKCWNGFTILSTEEGRLIDMNGNLVHLWKGKLHHPNKVFPGGYLLASTSAWKHGRQDAIQIQLRDFNDKVIWKFDHWLEGKANEGEGSMWLSRQHHDMQIKGNPVGYYIPNYNSLDVSEGILLALSHYNIQKDEINKNVRLLDDVVYEVDIATGKVIWTWKASDHLGEMGFDEAALKSMQNYKAKTRSEGDGFDWFHQNCVSYLGPNQWFDKGDKRFHPDNIILDSREAGLLAIGDHESGKIVWRAGPYYREGDDKKLGWIIGPHHTHMIPKGLPGEGNILLFDNGGQSGYGPPNDIAPNGIAVMRRQYSRVIEFNPLTKDIVWRYVPNNASKPGQKSGFDLFSPFISSAQRLPNGNTLITEGAEGRVIEVTKDHEVVWEYISPYTWDSSVPSIRNLVYRAYRIPYDWVPQLPKPKEVAVDPGPNYLFTIPAKDGSRPDFGIGKTGIWKQGSEK
jgi:hypothetical protein